MLGLVLLLWFAWSAYALWRMRRLEAINGRMIEQLRRANIALDALVEETKRPRPDLPVDYLSPGCMLIMPPETIQLPTLKLYDPPVSYGGA